jgi:hypothetical protein
MVYEQQSTTAKCQAIRGLDIRLIADMRSQWPGEERGLSEDDKSEQKARTGIVPAPAAARQGVCEDSNPVRLKCRPESKPSTVSPL